MFYKMLILNESTEKISCVLEIILLVLIANKTTIYKCPIPFVFSLAAVHVQKSVMN